jgi:hypothetical protein
VLADLPGMRLHWMDLGLANTVEGFSDLNFARVRATERYLSHSCDEVFVVVDIARACTNASILDIMRRCRDDQPRRIICTKSEVSAAGPEMGRCLLTCLLRTYRLKSLPVEILHMLIE